MKPEDIAKLPTPQTDELADKEDHGWEFVSANLSRSLEQRLAAAVMALEDCRKELLGAEHHVPSHTWSLAIQRVVGESKETIAAIRGGK